MSLIKLFKIAMLIAPLTMPTLTSASCVTELSNIVKTPYGRVMSPEKKPIVGAQIEVVDGAGEPVFETKSQEDGNFYLAVKAAKYRVKIYADTFIRFSYVVDLRGSTSGKTFDVWLQKNGQCHDMQISDEDADRCGTEPLKSNLLLNKVTRISGIVKDQTGAPFKNSEVRLVKRSPAELQPGDLDQKTDASGKFEFDEAEPGEYRLMASPNRGFAQPEKLDCYEQQECGLEIVLKVNPTDLPYAGCPVR